MSPTGIDLKVVADRLDLVARCLAELRALPSDTLEHFLSDRRNWPAAESHLRRAIESLFDTARHLVAKGFGIGKLEYREIAKLAGENGLVLDRELAKRFVHMGGFRNRLVHHYEEVTAEELYEVVVHHIADLEALSAELSAAAVRLTS